MRSSCRFGLHEGGWCHIRELYTPSQGPGYTLTFAALGTPSVQRDAVDEYAQYCSAVPRLKASCGFLDAPGASQQALFEILDASEGHDTSGSDCAPSGTASLTCESAANIPGVPAQKIQSVASFGSPESAMDTTVDKTPLCCLEAVSHSLLEHLRQPNSNTKPCLCCVPYNCSPELQTCMEGPKIQPLCRLPSKLRLAQDPFGCSHCIFIIRSNTNQKVLIDIYSCKVSSHRG